MNDYPFDYKVAETDRYTRFDYQYRDANNYKQGETVWLSGPLTPSMADELVEILRKADTGEPDFIPEEIGLPELQERMPSELGEDDHVWHEPQTRSANNFKLANSDFEMLNFY